MTIIDTFKELQAVYEKLQPPLLARFQPGASEERIRAAEEAIGLRFPDDLRELMKFANGQAPTRGKSSPYVMTEDRYEIHPMFPLVCFPTDRTRFADHTWWAGLDDLVWMTQQSREDIAEIGGKYEEVGPVRCHPNMIGFTITENASNLMIDLEPKPGGTVGQVVMVCTQPTVVAVISPSLHSFLSFLKDGFASGLFYCDYPRYGRWCDTRFIPSPNRG